MQTHKEIIVAFFQSILWVMRPEKMSGDSLFTPTLNQVIFALKTNLDLKMRK